MNFFKILLVTSLCWADPARISKIDKNLNEVDRIYLAPGLVSVIEMPGPILEVRVGDPRSVRVLLSSVSPKEMTLALGHPRASATNLIVRTDKRAFVFDLLPSRSNHQDFIKVRGGFQFDSADTQAVLLKTSLAGDARRPAEDVVESVRLGGSR
jgi:hypothetical protein